MLTTLLQLAVLACSIALTSAPAEDWSRSPEAAFLTTEERRQWKDLRSDESREDFKKLYWSRRDPNPLTETNEFREIVQARIRSADAQFSVGKTPGSRTARGLVLIVLGRPSTQQQTVGSVKGVPEMTTPGRISIPNDAFATTEFHTWGYDRATRPDLLNMLGASHVEIPFIVEPGHRDELQQPGRFHQWQEIVARESIVKSAVPRIVVPSRPDRRGCQIPIGGARML
jgi:GWxTD domain-containing protein